MKTVARILALSLAATLPALAERPQFDPRGVETVQQRFQEVKHRLALTPEQAEQVRPVLTGMIEVMKAVREDYVLAEGNPSTRRRLARELRAIQSHADARLKRVLSWEQMEEFRAIRREWRDEPAPGVVVASERK
jgi:hypothetical protein